MTDDPVDGFRFFDERDDQNFAAAGRTIKRTSATGYAWMSSVKNQLAVEGMEPNVDDTTAVLTISVHRRETCSSYRATKLIKERNSQCALLEFQRFFLKSDEKKLQFYPNRQGHKYVIINYSGYSFTNVKKTYNHTQVNLR